MMNQTQKHTTGKKLLALLLALIMTVSLLPMSVFAAEIDAEPEQNIEQSTEPAAEEPAADPAETVADPQAMVKEAAAVYAAATDTTFYKILHLDCGRKYFTKEWIIALLYEMQADGYNQLQLAFGNDGLRFLLDDMSFTANGTPYSHNTVVEKVEAGNAAQNSSGDGSWLTETEMDAIIAKANDLGIEIVPLLNLPGHANAILDIADNTYNASGSDNTLDVANSEEARNFGMAIFTKYVDYFAGKGCQFFNFGADEYANDISGTFTFSFSRLNSTQYGAFVGFINDLAAYINEKGMTPRAFNDGLYYNGQNVSIDTRIQCCYWSSGWDGYNVASAATISGKGHAMINTNGDFYYVLGKSDQFDSGYSYASNFSNTSFMGGTISNPVGSMFCIWCDYPNAETEAQVAANVRLVLRAMAARMSDQSIDTISTGVVTYGFNADGSPNTGGTETPDPTDPTEPSEPTETKTITVTVGQTATSTISGANYAGTYTTEDPSIATVEVTGVDAVEATTTYTEASVTCHNLISSNSNNWRAVSGYYYTPDGTNYYPVYAKRSSSWSWSSFSYTYTYTWGYSTTSSTSNVTQIGTQSTTDTSTTPNIKVYTQSTTEASDASTTITFTGVYPGTTYVTVGDTEYQINVAYKSASVSVIVDGNKTVSQTSTIMGEAVVNDPSVVSVSTSGSDVTFTGLKEGTTTVTVGDTIYTVTVSRENLTGKTLDIEYWITNGRPTDTNGDTAYTVNASDVYSADGVALAELVPGNTTKENRTLLFWRGRLLDKTLDNSSTSGTEEQTENEGDDDTYNGVEFTKVRYWDGKWSVYTENNEWVDVSEDHQLVAYYLEILPISDELTVTAADWGKKGDGSTSGDYLDPLSSCTVSVQVVYEDGTTNPATTTAADLKSRTIAYGYWENGRGIGTLNLVALEGYQIWKIEAETGAETYASSSSTWGSYTVNSFTWDNNPMTVYEGDAVDQYILHNDANNPSTDGYYENLMWDENHEAILIKVYLKAVAQKDSLTVNYFVQGESSPFYSYAINVNAGTTFDSGFAWQKDASAKGGAKLVNNTVVNSLGVTQTVQSDLSLMTQIGAQYRYSDFAFVEANRSEDGKTVNLYYTFNSTKTFVVDFGLPLVIKPTDMSEGLTRDKLTDIEINQTTTYANITTDEQYNITYKLKQTIDGQDNFGVKYFGTIDTGEATQSGSVSFTITIIPASTVYYEDSFVTFTDGVDAAAGATWTTDGTATSANQKLQELGSKEIYGYDDAYQNSTTFSMGSARKVTVSAGTTVNPTATFTFKGTGFDIISLTDNNSGAIIVNVANKEGSYNKNFMVNNYYGYQYNDGQWIVDTSGGNNALYQIPVMKVTGLTYDQYTVTVTVAYGEIFDKTGDSKYSFWLDAVRVYDPMGSDYDYTSDNEGYPQYMELRNQLIAGTVSTDTSKLLFIDGKENATIAEYQNYGPNNEVYLAQGQAISFTLSGELDKVATVQIGAKAPRGEAQMNVNGSALLQSPLNTATEMYYDITSQAINDGTRNQVTITNTGSGILSLTNLKITFKEKQESTVALATLSDEAQTAAVMTVRALFAAAPVAPEPEPTFAPERFEAAWNRSTVRAGQKVTLTVKTSEDVEAVMVDGVTIDTYRTRTQRTGWGRNATKVTYREFTYTITAAETADYAITAVNAEGIASEAITVTLTVQAASQHPGFGGWLDKIFGRWF